MRIKTIILLAALTAATPAAAQNTAAPADTNLTGPDATVSNEVPIDTNAMDANGMTTLPETAPVETTTVDTAYGEPAPAPRRGGFPWGVLGLLGLLGLIPRKNAR